ncbi:MAG TPA: prepilin-type N-terminal cleavage/methylation domain-containing protein [Conexibacter sp.]|nr:prepilin-type N-terminal cleavage/methylation domain-containing protein [Conexibacter sp.]
MSVRVSIDARLRDARGFTLVELLVSMTIGVGVLLATFAIFDSALLAQNRVDDRTDSIARGRTAMEQIVQQLRSQVCLGPGMPAIEYGDDSEVRFYADLANTTFVPERRVLTYAGGTLTQQDYSGSATGGSPPFTFSALPSRTRVILDRMTLASAGGVPIPFFTYYGFDGSTPPQPTDQLSVPLSDTDRARVVQIRVSFMALPSRASSSSLGEPFTTDVFVRTADPSDPEHSPLCI